jgi:23S rRNA pseudouridine1911/1915/1917 synthase
MHAHHVYYVDAAHEGARLDRFLAAHLRALSRMRIKVLIASGHVTVDGSPARPALRLRRGQRVDVTVPPPPPEELVPQALPLDVVYEDAHLVVINKPPGLTVHPGAGRPAGTLVNALLARYPDLAGVGGPRRPGIVHRLDKDTSGLMVVARTPQAYASLQRQLAERTLRRVYLALVRGLPPHEEGVIAAPIGRHPRHRTRMAVRPDGRPAVTRYRVRERFARHALVEATLLTGRTHQIRVHFAHLGHPVVGDPVYGHGTGELGLRRQALHAWQLELRHPVTGAPLVVEAPPPPDFVAALDAARAQEEPRHRRTRPTG